MTDIVGALALLGEAQDKIDQAILILSANTTAHILNVPYRSQHDADAGLSRADCGPTCIAMILQFYGKTIPIDDITKIAGTGATNSNQLKSASAHWQLTLTLNLGITLSQIEGWIDTGHPFIALVDYEKFGTYRQDQGYNLLHWVVVVGYDKDSIYINDPDYQGTERPKGEKRPIPRSIFTDAQQTLKKGAWNAQGLVA
jgi:uncharacterized protein YvpB